MAQGWVETYASIMVVPISLVEFSSQNNQGESANFIYHHPHLQIRYKVAFSTKNIPFDSKTAG